MNTTEQEKNVIVEKLVDGELLKVIDFVEYESESFHNILFYKLITCQEFRDAVMPLFKVKFFSVYHTEYESYQHIFKAIKEKNSKEAYNAMNKHLTTGLKYVNNYGLVSN